MFIKIYVRNVRISYKLNKLSAKIDFDTAENEPCEVCPLSVYRPSRSSEASRRTPMSVSACGRNVLPRVRPQSVLFPGY